MTLPDGKALELPDGATGADAAAAIGPGLARAALAIEVTHAGTGGKPRGARPRTRAARRREHLDRHARERRQALELIRHDAAHVLADGGDGALRRA